MLSKIGLWGNSLAVRIPKPYAEDIGFEDETSVNIIVKDGNLVIEKHTPETPTLDELVAGITPENSHGEIDFRGPVGNEAW